jgi:hypothetical protein
VALSGGRHVPHEVKSGGLARRRLLSVGPGGLILVLVALILVGLLICGTVQVCAFQAEPGPNSSPPQLPTAELRVANRMDDIVHLKIKELIYRL